MRTGSAPAAEIQHPTRLAAGPGALFSELLSWTKTCQVLSGNSRVLGGQQDGPFTPLPYTCFSAGRNGSSMCCYMAEEQLLTQDLMSSWGLSLLL